MRGCWSRLHKMMPEAEAQTMRAQAWLWFRGRAQTSRRQTDEAARLRSSVWRTEADENKRKLARGRESAMRPGRRDQSISQSVVVRGSCCAEGWTETNAVKDGRRWLVAQCPRSVDCASQTAASEVAGPARSTRERATRAATAQAGTMAAGRETDRRREGEELQTQTKTRHSSFVLACGAWSVKRCKMELLVGSPAGQAMPSDAAPGGSAGALFGCLCGWCPHRHGQGVVRCVGRLG